MHFVLRKTWFFMNILQVYKLNCLLILKISVSLGLQLTSRHVMQLDQASSKVGTLLGRRIYCIESTQVVTVDDNMHTQHFFLITVTEL